MKTKNAVLMTMGLIAILVGSGCERKGNLEQENLQMASKLATISFEFNELKKNNARLEVEKISINASNAVLIKSLGAENKAIIDFVGTLSNMVISAETTASALVKQNADLTNQLAALQAEKTMLAGQLEALKTNNLVLMERVGELNAKLTNNPTPAPAISSATAPILAGGVRVHLISPVTPGVGGVKNSQFTTNGITGGVPAMFINKSNKKVTVYLRQTAGTYTITLSLPPGIRPFNLAPGQWQYTSSVEKGPTDSTERAFTVDKEATHYYDGIACHGGIEFRGENE